MSITVGLSLVLFFLALGNVGIVLSFGTLENFELCLLLSLKHLCVVCEYIKKKCYRICQYIKNSFSNCLVVQSFLE